MSFPSTTPQLQRMHNTLVHLFTSAAAGGVQVHPALFGGDAGEARPKGR